MLHPLVTPEGVLLCEGEADSAMEKKLRHAGRGAALLLVLATEGLTAELPPGWRWLREGLARPFFTRLCQTRAAHSVAVPSLPDREAWLASAPPMTGAEYLSPGVLEAWWQELAERVAFLAQGQEEVWLRETCPAWHVIGRVTFHLAENRTDSQRPFAFLATFTEKLSASGQPQHLPLARALQLYAERKDADGLQALLEPVRCAAAQSSLLSEWLETRRLFQPMAMTPEDAYRVLRDATVFQACGIVMKLPDWWQQGKTSRPVVAVTIDAPKHTSLHPGALLSFQMTHSLDGEPLTPAEWEKLLSVETGLVSLRGRWVEVNGAQLRQVMAHWQKVQQAAGEGMIGFLDGMRLLAGYDPRPSSAIESTEALVPEWSVVTAGEHLRTALESAFHPPELPQPPRGLRATMRPYQLAGYAWLRGMTRLGLGACLADDMGLGKTLQVIALLQARHEEQSTADLPTLIVVPASLLGNWKAEVARFAPQLRLFVAHPSQSSSEMLTRVIQQPREALRGWDVMLTTYTLLQRHESWLQVPWGWVVLDEAQAIKNAGSASAKAVKRLQAPCRLALTGTPVENRPGDLWSLFDFLNPGLLGSSAAFAEVVKRCAQSREGFAPLRRLVKPYLLRRMKTDRRIITDLPEKIELKAFCGLTRRQGTLYAKLVDQLSNMLADKNLDPLRRQGLVLGFLLQFKQICNHPSHWNGDAIWKPTDSGKFIRLAEICTELAERGERVLIFTQFQETCEPLARHLQAVFGREGLLLHGGTPVSKRPSLVEAFQKPGGPPFMVISVKAGGIGLNLTAASHVIHFDRWWNPAVENQATDRAFRIGQKQQVIVHKFVCQGTLEERIDAMIEEKMALAQDLIGEGGPAEKAFTEMSPEELLAFVRLDVTGIENGTGMES